MKEELISLITIQLKSVENDIKVVQMSKNLGLNTELSLLSIVSNTVNTLIAIKKILEEDENQEQK